MVTMTADRLLRLRKIGLFAGFGLLVFIVALYMSFPYDRAKEAAIRMASKNLDVDVEIGSAGPAFGLAVMFRDIRVRTRPSTGKPTRFTIDSAKFSPSIFAVFSSTFPFSLALDGAGRQGRAQSAGGAGKEGRRSTSSCRRATSTWRRSRASRETINMPISGKLKLEIDISSETGRYADANGFITLTCTDVVAGDGKTPLKVAGNPFLSGGPDAAADAHRRPGRSRRCREGERQDAGGRVEVPGRRGGARGRDRPPRSAAVVDGEPLSPLQAERRLPGRRRAPSR